MTTLLFLDDERYPCNVTWMKLLDFDNLIIVRSYVEFVNYIKTNGMPDSISFDHDIQDFDEFNNELTGYDCAKWLVDYCQNTGNKIPKYTVHSLNPNGKENIHRYLENYKSFLGDK